MNRRVLFVAVVLVAILLPFGLAGQDKKDADSVTITGCFNKGADADHYVIKDEKTGKDVVVMGDATQLSRHANNHQVALTGMMSKDKNMDVLKVGDGGLKMIAVCK